MCREFGISRVTGYKIFNRYKECVLDALNDCSRRPYRHANKLPFRIERSILGIKREHPSWGAPKIRDKLIRQYPMIKPPAISTVLPCSIVMDSAGQQAGLLPSDYHRPSVTLLAGMLRPEVHALRIRVLHL